MSAPIPPAESRSCEVVVARPVDQARAPSPPLPLGLPTVTRRDAVLDLGLVVLVLLLIPFGFDLTAALMMPELLDVSAASSDIPLQAILISRKWFDALLAVGLAGYLLYRHRLPPSGFGLQADRLGRQVLWSLPVLLGVYGVFFGMALAIWLLMFWIPGLEQVVEQRDDFMELMPVDNLAGALLLLIPVAIHEELLFRGLLIPYLRRVGCQWWLAILISSSIFAVLHVGQGWLGAVQIFGVGVALGLFFVISRSLTAVMIAHFVFNLVQLQVVRFVLPWLEEVTQEV